MEVKQYIVQKIQGLVDSFPNIRARYEYDEPSNTHFVEVVPNEVFQLDEDYIAWEESVTFDFIDLFPDQNLTFISDDAIVGLDRIDFEAKGELFDHLYTFSDDDFVPAAKISIKEAEINFDFSFSGNNHSYALAA